MVPVNVVAGDERQLRLLALTLVQVELSAGLTQQVPSVVVTGGGDLTLVVEEPIHGNLTLVLGGPGHGTLTGSAENRLLNRGGAL